MSKKISVQYTGETEESFLEYGGICTMGSTVPTDNIEEIEKALTMLGYNIWEICNDDGMSGNRIKASPLLLKWEQKREEEKEAHDMEMLKSVEEFNAHDKVFTVWRVGTYTVKVEKYNDTPAEYRPGLSSRVNGSVAVRIYDNEEKPITHLRLRLDNYVTSNGSIQRKRFAEHHPEIPADIAERLLNLATTFYDERKKVCSKYHLR